MRRSIPAVDQHRAVSVAADEITPVQHIERRGPFVCMNGRSVAGRQAGIQDSHSFVFEQHPVMIWCNGHRVERVRRHLSIIRQGRWDGKLVHPGKAWLRHPSPLQE